MRSASSDREIYLLNATRRAALADYFGSECLHAIIRGQEIEAGVYGEWACRLRRVASRLARKAKG